MTEEKDLSLIPAEHDSVMIDDSPSQLDEHSEQHFVEDSAVTNSADIRNIPVKRPLSWQIIRIIGFFFIGWSGLQVIFLPNLLFISLNNESLYSLLSSLMTNDVGFLPLTLFLVTTYIIAIFIMHMLTEMEYRSRLNHYVIQWSDVPVIFVNYGIPLIMQFLFVMLLELFVLSILLILYHLLGNLIPFHIDAYEFTYRILIVFITFPWIIMQFMMDTTLERAVKGRSFRYCFRRAKYLLNHKTLDVMRYLLVRFTLIVLSFLLYKVFILLVALPFKIHLFYRYDINTNIMFGDLYSMRDVIMSVLKMIVGVVFAGIVFAPLSTPLYWLNTRIIRNYLYRSGQH
ncbi:MAG TPA: hypothetical protein PLE74_02205 [Candidatus Cloacimonadota bacterium]|nr:hypothetical protein [Candidatus Cloacimonadota bacterium]HPT71075.1 hypothetical protein [Candidatus Cloacimonadota bacterium]